MVQGHHIRHRAQGDQIQEISQIGRRTLGAEPTALPQAGPQGGEQIEDDADAGDGLAGKLVSRSIGVDDRCRGRQLGPGEVMVGDDDRNPQLVGPAHAGQAGGAVVHREDQIGPEWSRRLHQTRAQPIAEGESARDQIGDPGGTHCT